MSTIGNTLKEARTKKSISLDEVHAKLKIHPRVLQLLEEDKFEKLPSLLYAKSFLKSYAEFLEVDPDKLLQDFEKQGYKDPPQEFFIRPAQEKQRPETPNQLVRSAWVIAVAAVIAVVFVLGVKALAKAVSDHKKTTVSPKKKAEPTPAPAPAAPRERKGEGEWLRSVEDGNFPKLGKASLSLQVKAIDNVWLRVTCDGKVLFQSILRRGASETWKARDAIEIWTGNSSSMDLTLNRYPLGSPGRGVIKKMIIDHEGVRKL